MCFLKIMEKSRADYLPFVNELINSGNTFFVRAGLVALLSHYADSEFADVIFNALDSVEYGEYYVDMAAAWLVSVAYIKFPDQTNNYLLNNRMSDFAYNKG